MNELDLCSYVATAVALFGLGTPLMRTTCATDEGIMTFGLILTVVLFLIGLGGLL